VVVVVVVEVFDEIEGDTYWFSLLLVVSKRGAWDIGPYKRQM
jgi:hypothetical protein